MCVFRADLNKDHKLDDQIGRANFLILYFLLTHLYSFIFKIKTPYMKILQYLLLCMH